MSVREAIITGVREDTIPSADVARNYLLLFVANPNVENEDVASILERVGLSLLLVCDIPYIQGEYSPEEVCLTRDRDGMHVSYHPEVQTVEVESPEALVRIPLPGVLQKKDDIFAKTQQNGVSLNWYPLQIPMGGRNNPIVGSYIGYDDIDINREQYITILRTFVSEILVAFPEHGFQ